jgi:hypothetical protein
MEKGENGGNGMKSANKRIYVGGAVALCFCLASLLSMLPSVTAYLMKQPPEVPVFHSAMPNVITQANLVDFLGRQSLQLSLRRVEWQDGRLELILEQVTGSREGSEQEIFHIIKTSLTETKNINELDIVVHYPDGSGMRVRAERGQIQRDPAMRNVPSQFVLPYLEEMFDVTPLSP